MVASTIERSGACGVDRCDDLIFWSAPVSVHDQETEATAQAINSALEAGLIVRCPIHQTELVAVGSEEMAPAVVPAGVRARVMDVLASLPKSCPRCAEDAE
jgi:hypothetical protein